jgi:integrase
MPLIVTSRAGSLVIAGTVTPAGAQQGVRVRRRAGSNDVRLAREEAAALEAQILRDHYHGARAAVRGWAEAVVSYLTHQPRGPGTKALLARLVRHWRSTPLDQINQAAIDIARSVVLRPGAAPATVRRNLIAPASAVLHHAARRGWCQLPAFDVPAEPRGRIRFLLPADVAQLITTAGHLRPLVVFLACTGCRLGEALGLQWDAVDLRGARALLHEDETKGGRRRVVALPPAVVAALGGLPGRSGAVFRAARKTRLDDGTAERLAYRTGGDYGGQVRKSWGTACTRADLVGVTPHMLRHTWATWHYALHRDLLRLKTEGGWATASQVERYAHLMPEGHEAEIRAVWGAVVPVANIDTRLAG